MSDMDNVTQKVIDAVAFSLCLEASDITEDSLLITELGADSLDVMDMMFKLEETFSIKLQSDDFNFYKKLGFTEKNAIENGFVKKEVLQKLKYWLPTLELEKNFKPPELGKYLSIKSIVTVIRDKLKS